MNEKKIIEDLLISIESDKTPIYTKFWFKIIFWGSLTACFYGFNWMLDHDISKYIVLIGSCLVGGVIGFIAFLQVSEQAWPIVKQHINKESLQERLKVLNS